MRTTLDIDDDILAAAKDLAKAEGRTMGQVVAELARRGLTQPGFAGPAGLADGFGMDAWPTFPQRARNGPATGPQRDGPPVTSEMIERIENELDQEDAVPFGQSRR